MANITTLDLGPVRQVYKGEYSPSVPYDLLNTVFYQGESWVIIKTPYIAGSTPSIDSPYWQKIAVKGLDGEDGKNGTDGKDGEQGPKGDKGDPGELILPEATTAQKGVIQIATDSEVVNGTVKNKAVTPKQVKDNFATKTDLATKQAKGDYATATALSTGLNGKANKTHTHTVANVTGLQTALDGKLSVATFEGFVDYGDLGSY